MSDKIDDNNDKIDSGKRRIKSIQKQRNKFLERAAAFKKKMEEDLENARKLDIEQNRIREKNRTHAMILLSTTLLKFFPELEKAEKDLISNEEFAALNNLILSQIKNHKDGKSEIDWNCTLPNKDVDLADKEISDPNDGQQYDTTVPEFDQLNVLHNASKSQKEFVKDAWAEISRILQTCQNSDNFTDVLNLINYYRSADKPNLIIDDFKQIRLLGLDTEKLQCLISLHNNN